jgi:hypothetical protein
MDELRFKQIEESLDQILLSQTKISAALLGSYEKNAIGLIEEARILRREVDELRTYKKDSEIQIKDLMEAKRDARKIIVGLGFLVPIVFSILKAGAMALFEVFRSAGK